MRSDAVEPFITTRCILLERTLIGVGGLVLLFLLPHQVSSDGLVRYDTLRVLMDKGTISPEKYSFLQTVLSVPLYLAGEFVAGKPQTAVAYFNVLVFLASLGVFWYILRNSMRPHVLRRFLLLLMGASMFTHHVQTYYGEVLTACAVLIGIAWSVSGHANLGSAAISFGVLNTPAALVAQALVELAAAFRRRAWLRAAVPVVITIIIFIGEFWWRRGSPFASGYQEQFSFKTVMPYSGGNPGFNYPFLLGLMSIFFSFGKGLLIFIPGLLLCVTPALQRLDHTLRSFQAAALLFTAGLVLVYAKYWAWYAGWYWGPRYFLFACIPGTMALAWHLTYPSPRSGIRALSLAATMWSGWVGICGAIFGQEGMEICINNDFALEALCWYTPEYSALIHPFIQPRSFSRRELVTATWIVAATATLVVPHLRPLFANIVRRVRVLRLSDLL